MSIEQYGTVIYKTYAGSRSYGTNITMEMAKKRAEEKGGNPEDYLSDVDIRGIFIPHRKYLFGQQTVDEYRDPTEEDTVYFSLRKFVQLAIECNPNVVEQLFVREEDILYMHPIGKELRDMRYEFLTKNAYGRFGSYAWSQLNKMTNRTEAFQRNAKRQQLIDIVGGDWDPKNAMHLIRLLFNLLEILDTGDMQTFASQRELLLKIRNGEYSLQEVLELSNELFEKAEHSLQNSTIPNVPDVHKVNQWMVQKIDELYSEQSGVGSFPQKSLTILPMEYEMIDQCTLFLVSNPLVRKQSKSEAHGLAIPYKDWFTGLYEFREFKFEKTTIEFIYKFMNQVRKCNPRHIDTLFAPASSFLYKHEMADEFFALAKRVPTAKQAYHTIKGYMAGNLAKMDKWESLKKHHTTLREQIVQAKAIPASHFEQQLRALEEEKEMYSKTYERQYDELFMRIIAVQTIDEKDQWKALLQEKNQQYRNEMEKLRQKKDTILKQQQIWSEQANKKGNLPLYPPIPDGTQNENASYIGKFSYDTLLASDVFHKAVIFKELIETGTIKNSRAYEAEMYAIKHGKYKTYADFRSVMVQLLEAIEAAYHLSQEATPASCLKEDELIDFITRYLSTLKKENS